MKNANKKTKHESSRQENSLSQPAFLRLINELLSGLPERSQEIMKKRFGFSSEKGETLEKIGRFYGITRERVRQIISEAMKNVMAKAVSDNFKEMEKKVAFAIKENNGIIKEKKALAIFAADNKKEANAIKFFVDCSESIFSLGGKDTLEKSWAASKDSVEKAKTTIQKAGEIFSVEKKLMNDREIAKKLISGKIEFSENEILSFLDAAKSIKKNVFGKWGVADWSEVTPKGTREKVYLILKEKNQPLHFTQIASFIDEHKLGKRKAHPQTVHNELIKDERFVLIGRGIYALKEWGYTEGTIKDVIKMILGKNSKPMGQEEIMQEVMKVRKVKKATIMINLNNSEIFQKTQNAYTLKK